MCDENIETMEDLKIRADKLWNDIITLSEKYWDMYESVFGTVYCKRATAETKITEDNLPF